MTQVLMDTHSQVPMVGASGAIGGVLGAYLINHPNAKVLVLIPFGFFSQLNKNKSFICFRFLVYSSIYIKWRGRSICCSYWRFYFWYNFDIIF